MMILRCCVLASVTTLAFVLVGCGAPGLHEGFAAQAESTNARLADHCSGTATQLLATYCTLENERSAAQSQVNPVKQQAAALHAQCERHPSVAPKLAELDACSARLDASIGQENAAQAQRLPKVRGKVAIVRADPEYVKQMEAWKSAEHALTVASDNWEIAKRERNPRVLEYQARWEAAKQEESPAAS